VGRVVLAAVAAILAMGAGGGTQTGEVITDSKAYAVYAAALQQRLTVEGTHVERITLLGETRAGDLEAKCVSADRIYPEWVPIVESYRAENAHIRLLAPGPDFAVPYAIVTYDDLSRRMEEAGWSLSRFNGSGAPGFDVFQKLPGGRLVALSAVG
jgi:hypothetical protein